jgi:ABC-type multidrug transport system fused ATPase/permease subunit
MRHIDISRIRRAAHGRFPTFQKRTAMSNFWDVVMLMVSTFFFIAYLIIMFQIVVDLFRDTGLGGGSKVLWVVGLIFVPVLTAIVYIVARGQGMATRQQASLQRAKSDTETYIREVAGTSPAGQIAEAKALLEAGTINQAEFDRLKAKALS